MTKIHNDSVYVNFQFIDLLCYHALKEDNYGFQLFFLVLRPCVRLPPRNYDVTSSLVFKSHVTRRPRDLHVVNTTSF